MGEEGEEGGAALDESSIAPLGDSVLDDNSLLGSSALSTIGNETQDSETESRHKTLTSFTEKEDSPTGSSSVGIQSSAGVLVEGGGGVGWERRGTTTDELGEEYRNFQYWRSPIPLLHTEVMRIDLELGGESSPVSSGELGAISSGELGAVSSGELGAVSSGDLGAVSSGELVAVSSGKLEAVSSESETRTHAVTEGRAAGEEVEEGQGAEVTGEGSGEERGETGGGEGDFGPCGGEEAMSRLLDRLSFDDAELLCSKEEDEKETQKVGVAGGAGESQMQKVGVAGSSTPSELPAQPAGSGNRGNTPLNFLGDGQTGDAPSGPVTGSKGVLLERLSKAGKMAALGEGKLLPTENGAIPSVGVVL